MLFAFIWLNAIIAKEIWNRRRPITANTNSGVKSFENDEQSTDKRTSETNTVSNDLNGRTKDGCILLHL